MLGGIGLNLKSGIKKKLAAVVIVIFFFLQLAFLVAEDIQNDNISIKEGLIQKIYMQCIKLYNPFLMYVDSDWEQRNIQEKVWYCLQKNIPVEQYTRANFSEEAVSAYMQGNNIQQESGEKEEPNNFPQSDQTAFHETTADETVIGETVVRETSSDTDNANTEYHDEIPHSQNSTDVAEFGENDINENNAYQTVEEVTGEAGTQTLTDDERALQEAVIAENQIAANTGVGMIKAFVPPNAPVATYSEQQLQESGFIKETFYSEDPTTQIQETQVQYQTLMGFDAVLKQDNSAPQILVYHTHSQERYLASETLGADSTAQGTTVVDVGEYLCNLLRDQYGYNVIHHLGQYDVETRDDAYANAKVGLEQVLAENPTIEVIIDLHRDETNPNTKLVTTVQDIPMAKFMFFNGLSYTRQIGTLNSLPNPYVQDNLSFAFQMQLAAEEYYPGLTRRIYLKGYRYNLHYRPKSLLIELGSQTNTVDEALNACQPLAHIISMVLNGENK